MWRVLGVDTGYLASPTEFIIINIKHFESLGKAPLAWQRLNKSYSMPAVDNYNDKLSRPAKPTIYIFWAEWANWLFRDS